MKHKGLVGIFLVMVLLASLVAACAAPTPTPTPTPTPAPTPTPTPSPTPSPTPTEGEVIEWKVFHSVANTADARDFPVLAEAVESATSGRLKIDVFLPGEHPFAAADLPKALRDGDCQIAPINGGKVVSVEPRLAVMDVPMLLPGGDFDTWREVYDILADTYFKEIWAEWNCQELIPHHHGAQQIFLKEGWVENWDSLKGKNIRVWSTDTGKMIELLNGTSVRIDWGEVYTSLQTGLVDGLITSFFGAYSTRLTEVCKNVNMITMQYATVPYCVNRDALNELPPDVRDALLRVMQDKREWFETGTIMADGLTLQIAFLTDQVKCHPVPSDFREEIWRNSYEGIWKSWIENAGPQGADAFNAVAKILTDKGHEVPGYTAS